MEKETVRVYARISGRVQGVCYRWFTRDTADEIGVTGWVRNLPDGAVELVAEGTRDRIEALLDYCRQGPDMARVDDLEISWEEPTGEFSGFSIRH